jgi:hypothetical protein
MLGCQFGLTDLQDGSRGFQLGSQALSVSV